MKRIKILAKDSYMLIVAFICICALVFAWFNNSKEGNAEDMNFVSIESVGFEVSINKKDYYDDLEISYPKNLDMVPVSGDGETMYMPILPTGSDGSDEKDLDNTSWFPIDYAEDAERNHFYRMHLYFQADVDGYVALSGIDISPKAKPENRQNGNYTNVKGEEVSVSGEVENPFLNSLTAKLSDSSDIITKDYIAAAARVSITNTGEIDSESKIAKRFIVVPNAGYKLEKTEITNINTGEKTYKLEMYESPVDPEKVNAQKMYHYYEGKKTSYGARDFNVYYDSTLEASQVYVLQLFKDDVDGMFKGEVDVCLWIEGFDEEACDFLAGGEITMSLKFNYVESAPG